MRRQCRTKKKTSIGNTIQKTCVTKYVDTVLEHFDEGLFCEYFENTAKIVAGRIDAFHRSQSIPTLNLSKFHYKPPSAPKLNIPKYSTFENRHAWSILILQNQTCLNSGNLVISKKTFMHKCFNSTNFECLLLQIIITWKKCPPPLVDLNFPNHINNSLDKRRFDERYFCFLIRL